MTARTSERPALSARSDPSAGIASTTVGSTARVRRRNGNRRAAWTRRVPRGGAGDPTQSSEEEEDFCVEIVRKRSSSSSSSSSSSREEEENTTKSALTGTSAIPDGGCGKSALALNEQADAGVPGTAGAERVNCASGSCTCPDHNLTTAERARPSPQTLGGTGSNSLVQFLDIIYRLFPSAASGVFSTYSARLSSAEPASLHEALTALDALAGRFAELSQWFERHVPTDESRSMGFELAMEVCGCYDLTVGKIADVARESLKRAGREMDQVAVELLSLQIEDEEFETLKGGGERGEQLGPALDLAARWRFVRRAVSFLAEECARRAPLRTERVRSELSRAKLDLAELERERSSACEKARSSRLLYEECRSELAHTKDRMNLLREELDESQKALECRTASAHSLESERRVHDAERAAERDALLRRLREGELLVESLKVDRGNACRELELRIVELEQNNARLSETVRALRGAARTSESRHAEETQQAHLDTVQAYRSVDEHKRVTAQLRRELVLSEERNRESDAQVRLLTEEACCLGRETRHLQGDRRTLRELLRHLGVDGTARDPIEELHDRIRRSVERIESGFRHVIQLKKEEPRRGDEPQGMEQEPSEGQFFTTYEREVGQFLADVFSELIGSARHGGEKRPHASAKRRHATCSERESDSDTRGGTRPAGETGFAEAAQSKKNKPCCTVETTGKKEEEQTEENVWPAEGLCRPRVGAFTLDVAQNGKRACVLVPKYTYASLSRGGDVKVLALGHSDPVRTLLEVLQVETGARGCPEIDQSECHCFQMERLATLLECKLVICWSPGGGHEVYGRELTQRSAYIVIAIKTETLRSYYLLCLALGNLYVYDFTPREFSVRFSPPVPAYSHRPGGSCCGPPHVLHVELEAVQVLETCDVVLTPAT